VPLQADAEASLFILVERPDLDAPKLRTVGLKIVLGRLETLLGGLPIDGRQRTRMVDTRKRGDAHRLGRTVSLRAD
jgi:hypothetical protein